LLASGVGVLPFLPFAPSLGLRPLPGAFLAYLVGVTVAYLALVEAVKRRTLTRILG
jgi:hypothetical protein